MTQTSTETQTEIRAEASAFVEAAKRKNLSALRTAALEQLAGRSDDAEAAASGSGDSSEDTGED